MNNEVIPMTKLKGKLGTIRHNILNVFRLRGWSNKIRINQEIYFVGSPRFLKFPDFKKICDWIESGELVFQISDQEPVDII